MISIAPENHLYHLSYDLIGPYEDEKSRNDAHKKLKEDLVWEILIALKGKTKNIYSPVASTIIFESCENYDYWNDKISKMKNAVYFSLSEVAKIDIFYPNRLLNNNFRKEFVDNQFSIQQELLKRNRIPSSRF